MANDITQQLEEWKKKYYQSITDLEKQQTYDDLLQRSLGRLALAAQGLDPALDKQLKSLRSVLRGKSNQQEIEHILKQMEKAIARMESSKSENATHSTGVILADLLNDLKLAKAFKPEAKTLSKQFKSTDDKDIPEILPDLLSFLDNCLNTTSSQKSSSSFGFNIFGRAKPSVD